MEHRLCKLMRKERKLSAQNSSWDLCRLMLRICPRFLQIHRGYRSNDLNANNKTLKQICMLKASPVNQALKGVMWAGAGMRSLGEPGIVSRLQVWAFTGGSKECALLDCSLGPDPVFQVIWGPLLIQSPCILREICLCSICCTGNWLVI